MTTTADPIDAAVLHIAIVDAAPAVSVADVQDLLTFVEAEMHEAAIDVERAVGGVEFVQAARYGFLSRLRGKIVALLAGEAVALESDVA